MRRRSVLFAVLLAGVYPGWLLLGSSPFTGPIPEPLPSIRGVTMDARQSPSDSTLIQLEALGVSHVAVIPYGFMPDATGTELRFRTDHRWYSESDSGIENLSSRLTARGMSVVIKPQLWIGRATFTGDMGFDTEDEWLEWEAGYRTYILHHADLATQVDASLFVVGTELLRASTERPAFWRALIRDVRDRYDGKVTYAANWYREVEEVTFWDDLDFIGVQGYYPLVTDGPTDLAALTRAWSPYKAVLRRLSERYKLPVLFTELGYRSIDYAAAEPWRWPSRAEFDSHQPDYALQQRLYEAFFDAVWPEPWMAGMFVWKWHADTGRRSRALDFTPQGKPAMETLARGYARR